MDDKPAAIVAGARPRVRLLQTVPDELKALLNSDGDQVDTATAQEIVRQINNKSLTEAAAG